MKKIIIFLVSFIFIPNVLALSVQDIKINNYVNDNANVLSTDTIDYMNTKSSQLENVDGTQIVVVTINTLEDNDLEDFANELYNHIGIGDKKESKGLLILLVVQDRKLRVEVGDGLEGILNDAKVGRFEDTYMISYLADDNWNDGVKNGYDAFFNEIVKQNNLDLDTTQPVTYTSTRNIPDVLGFIIMGAFYILIFYSALGSARYGKNYNLIDATIIGIPYLPGLYFTFMNPIEVYKIVLLTIAVVTTLVYLIARNSKPTSRRYSYGGSSWSSSGGHSSGGFSGGGGHSSGGGASRSF